VLPTDETTPAPLIGALLRGPWQVVRDHLLAGLHARGFDDLTAAHLSVLQYPGPDAARPSDLAARARMTRQALNYLLGQLERLGYVERRDDPQDGARRVYVTDRGAQAMDAAREIVADLQARWEEELGPERFATLRALLAELNAVAAATPAPRGA